FLLGSFKYQVHKTALTYGMLLVVSATFCGLRTSAWHEELATLGWPRWVRLHFLSFHGLDDLVHADTMLFILGLTLFVAVIAQTRLLEGVTYVLLRRYRGAIEPTVIAVTAAVAAASGILGGVSLISLTIRTLVIVLMLAAAPVAAIRYAIMLCTAVTTICGVFSAYGEPPNLIMKANLAPHLGNDFFLYYCGPVAVVSYFVVAWQLRRRLRGGRIDVDAMDVIDANVADVRFLQATRHGEVLTPVELIEGHAAALGDAADRLLARGKDRIRRVLLPVPALRLDHAAHGGGFLRPHRRDRPRRRHGARPVTRRVRPVSRVDRPVGRPRQQRRRGLRLARAAQPRPA